MSIENVTTALQAFATTGNGETLVLRVRNPTAQSPADFTVTDSSAPFRSRCCDLIVCSKPSSLLSIPPSWYSSRWRSYLYADLTNAISLSRSSLVIAVPAVPEQPNRSTGLHLSHFGSYRSAYQVPDRSVRYPVKEICLILYSKLSRKKYFLPIALKKIHQSFATRDLLRIRRSNLWLRLIFEIVPIDHDYLRGLPA
jgi:hypothetical protein